MHLNYTDLVREFLFAAGTDVYHCTELQLAIREGERGELTGELERVAMLTPVPVLELLLHFLKDPKRISAIRESELFAMDATLSLKPFSLAVVALCSIFESRAETTTRPPCDPEESVEGHLHRIPQCFPPQNKDP